MRWIGTHDRTVVAGAAGRLGARRGLAVGLAGLGVRVAAGCARADQQAAAGGSAFDARATAVAEAWRAAVGQAGARWSTGFVPLEDLTVLPAQSMTDDALAALASGRFEPQQGALPDGTPGQGSVTYPDGTSSTVPVITAKDAYAALSDGACGAVGGKTTVRPGPGPADPSGAVPQTAGALPPDAAKGPDGGNPTLVTGSVVAPAAPASAPADGRAGNPGPTAVTRSGVVGAPARPGCEVFTITGATLGTAQVRTTRGTATAPAWLFTVSGVPAPVARIAVASDSVLAVPTPSVPPLPSGPATLVSAERVTGSDAGQLDFVIGIGACDTNPTAQVKETPDAVVIGGTVDRPTGGVCSDLLKLQPVSVQLSEPLGDRAVLDAVTGQPLTT